MQKQYAALVWTSRPLEDDDLLSISSLKDLVRSSESLMLLFHCSFLMHNILVAYENLGPV